MMKKNERKGRPSYFVGSDAEEIPFTPLGEHAYAVEITGSSMESAYRDGTTVLMSPTSPVRSGDRAVVKMRNGEVVAKEPKRRTSKRIELRSLNLDHKERTLSVDEVQWIARIMWASQ